MSELVLDVAQLRASYGKVQALHDINLKLERGSIATVIGPNGAGKSTLLNAIMGVLPAQGTVRYQGKPVERWSLEQRVMAGIALVPERRELFSTMSVEDNLLLGGFRRLRLRQAQPLDQLATVFGLFPRLKERAAQRAGTMSGGEQQMLAIGRALMSKPRLLLLDEPTLGLAPLVIAQIFEIIRTIRDSGVTVFLVEQNANKALGVADRGYVLENGHVVMSDTGANLLANSDVRKAYLGHG